MEKKKLIMKGILKNDSPTLLFSELRCKFFHSIRVHPNTLQHLFISRLYITCASSSNEHQFFHRACHPQRTPSKKSTLSTGAPNPSKGKVEKLLQIPTNLVSFQP